MRCVRAGLPDGDARGEVGHRPRHAHPHGDDYLRLLRRRLLLQGRAPRRRARAHGPRQGRRCQRGPLLRQGPLRLRLRHAHRSRAHPARAQLHRRALARGQLGGGDRLHCRAHPRHPVPPRRGQRRWHHVLALHQRGSLRRPEDDPRGLRHEQRRHLCPRLPLADRLWPQADLRHLGGHAGLQVRRGG